MSSVAGGQSVNPLLGQLIEAPQRLHVGEPTPIDDRVRDLDTSKRNVVAHALGSSGSALDRRPPGHR